jgi:hypothetical protein
MVPWLKWIILALSYLFPIDSEPAKAARTTLKFLKKKYLPVAFIVCSPFSPPLFLV